MEPEILCAFATELEFVDVGVVVASDTVVPRQGFTS